MARLRLLLSCLRPLMAKPGTLLPTLKALRRRFRNAGLNGVKIALLELHAGRPLHDKEQIWKAHQARLRELEPAAREAIASMPGTPLVSVLLPVYNTPPELLQRCIDSVRQQWYPHWELCVCDDASTETATLAVLERAAAADGRIRLMRNARNLNIAAASNRALAMARGSHVVLLDHDDLLQPQALFRLAQCILRHRPDFVYSDEALISREDDEILDFFFRPAFSPELLRSQPYIVHLIAFRREFLERIGRLDERLVISQDYDLILRAVEQARVIVHIPEILYCWRRLGGSAGHRMQARVMETSTRVLERHLARCGQAGQVTAGEFFNTFETRYPLQPGLRVALLIPNHNGGDLLRRCIESIEATVRGVAFEILVIDHRSDDPVTLDYLESLAGRCQVMRCDGPFNFSLLNNRGVAALEGAFSHYLFCNHDLQALETGWLERMLELGQQRDVAAVGAKLLYPDGRRIQHAGVGVGIFAAVEHYGRFQENRRPDGQHAQGHLGSLVCNREVSAVSAACMLFDASLFRRLGGFDERLAAGFGATDLCLRAREAGYRVLFCPHASLVHHGSSTRGTGGEHPGDTARFRERWREQLASGDPFYNPNLASDSYSWETKRQLPLALELRARVHGAGETPSAGR